MSRPWSALYAAFGRQLQARGSAAPLAFFRMGWALAMIVQAADERSRFALYAPGQFHLPLVSWLPMPTYELFSVLLRVSSWGALLALLGLCSRLAIATVVLSLGYLFASDVLLFRNHVYLGLLLGGLLACSPCGCAWSLDALIARALNRTPHGVQSLAASRLIQLQVLIVYAWSVLNKLRPSFLDGWTLQQELPHTLGGGLLASFMLDARAAPLPWLAAILDSDALMSAAAWTVVAVEAFLTLGLPNRRLRPYAMCCGLLLHLGIVLTLGIFTFGCLMVSSYVLFRDPRSSPPERALVRASEA